MKSLEYLAGLFDGEGSFSIQIGLRDRRTMWANPAMSLNLYYGESVLVHFQDRFGGHIYPYARNGQARGARWHIGTRVLVTAAAQALQPHLEIKQDIARRFLEALTLFPGGLGADRKNGGRVWTTERSVAVAEIALSLNPPRSRKSNKTAEYLQILKAGLNSPAGRNWNGNHHA